MSKGRYTQVTGHFRRNSKKPGEHWVRKHQRFLGFESEAKFMQPTRPRPRVAKVKRGKLREFSYVSDVDPKIRPVVQTVNELPETFTTGSCEGHPGSHPDFELPFVMGVSSADDLNVLVESASKSDLEFKIEPYLYWEENLPSDMRAWIMNPREGESFEGSHRKFARFQQLVDSHVN